MSEEPRLKGPALIEVGGEVAPDSFIEAPQGRAMEGVRALASRRASAFARLAAWVFGSLFSLVLTVAAWNFVTGLFAANPWLGGLASVLLALAVGVVLVLVVGELSAKPVTSSICCGFSAAHRFATRRQLQRVILRGRLLKTS